MSKPGISVVALVFGVVLGTQAAQSEAKPSRSTPEQTFPVLQIGTRFFTNATVTTHASNYVFIIHAQGLSNIKVSELSDEERVTLGYASTVKKQTSTATNAVVWARQKLASLQTPELTNLKQSWVARIPPGLREPRSLPLSFFLIAGAVLLVGHLFFSFCSMLICRKTGNEPGVMVWLPLVQVIPLLRAANMSPAWLIALLLPVLNIVASIVWCVKIVDARNKSPWLVVAFLLPVTNLLAFLYLAFSDGNPKKEERKAAPQVMTLETA
jgi:hypothetical protein